MTYMNGLGDPAGSQRRQWSRRRVSLSSSRNRMFWNYWKTNQADMLLICLIALKQRGGV